MDIDMEDYLMVADTDQELTHSTSDQSLHSDKSHRVTNGYEVCVHTCVEGGCISHKTSTILWRKEGHAVRRHANNRKVHPECTKECPARSLLGRVKTSHAGGRDATHQEVASHMGTEVADGLFSMVNASPAGGRNAMDQEVHHSQTMMNRRFNIIYIPDAAMRIVSKEKAKNDLGYIPASLSESEYEPLQHLTGSIHVISKSRAKHTNVVSLKVIMQEWVSLFF